MKKTLIAGLVGLLAAATFAGKDNVVVTFYTQGPDKYADDTQVLDGETYALVWTRDGATFQGIKADGNVVDKENSAIVLKAPVAKDGKCPFIKFEIDEALVKKLYPNGTWDVYLLDTRTFKTELKDGKPDATGAFGSAVNGYGKVATAKATANFASASAAGAMVAGAAPADKGEVKIRDIKLVDGKVFIYVSGTLSSAAYAVAEGTAPDQMTPTSAQVGNTAGDMIIIRDQQPGGAFFKVNRK